MKKIAIIQSNYIPWKGYFDIISRVDAFYLYDCVQYTDRDWRNRNRIKTVDGLKWLTIPLEYHSRSERVYDKIIADDSWREMHWKNLQHAYGKTPYFKLYRDELQACYENCKEARLSLVNLRFLELLKGLLGITTPLILLGDHEHSDDKNGAIVKLCESAGAKTYLTGPSTRSYLHEQCFNDAGIQVEWMAYDYPEYPQPYPPFEHQVSVLDLLFNTGKDAGRYIKASS